MTSQHDYSLSSSSSRSQDSENWANIIPARYLKLTSNTKHSNNNFQVKSNVAKSLGCSKNPNVGGGDEGDNEDNCPTEESDDLQAQELELDADSQQHRNNRFTSRLADFISGGRSADRSPQRSFPANSSVRNQQLESRWENNKSQRGRVDKTDQARFRKQTQHPTGVGGVNPQQTTANVPDFNPRPAVPGPTAAKTATTLPRAPVENTGQPERTEPDSDAEEQPTFMGPDGRERVLSKEPWVPIPNNQAESDMINCYINEQLKTKGSYANFRASGVLKRKRRETARPRQEDNTRKKRRRSGSWVSRESMSDSGDPLGQAADGLNPPPCLENADKSDLWTDVAISSIFNDPFNLITFGNPGMKEAMPVSTEWDRIRVLMVGYNFNVPEEVYCQLIARRFNSNVLPVYNESVLTRNATYIEKIEHGSVANCLPVQIENADGTFSEAQLDISGRLKKEHRNSIMKRGLAAPWTAEMVMRQRALQLNPINDIANMALNYKSIGKKLMDSGMLFENTGECYATGEPIKKLNAFNFRAMVKCDEMYQKIVASKSWLSIYSNRNTAANMGIKSFQEVATCPNTNELAEEIKQLEKSGQDRRRGGTRNPKVPESTKLISRRTISSNTAAAGLNPKSQSPSEMSTVPKKICKKERNAKASKVGGVGGHIL